MINGRKQFVYVRKQELLSSAELLAGGQLP